MMKNTVLKMGIPVFLICLVLAPTASSLTAKPKIFFTWTPGGVASYTAPAGSGFDGMYVWSAYMVSSTYGAFTLVLAEYYKVVSGVNHYTDHWYTTNLAAGQKYALLSVKIETDATDVWDHYDVTQVAITTNQPTTQMNYLSVKVGGSKPFSVQYWADTSGPITSALVGSAVSQNLFLGVKALRPLSKALVSGLSVGTFQFGQFRYVQTETYDQSLLS